MKEFSDILKELRNKKGITQDTLASIVHVSRSAIAKYENGLGFPSEEVANALCEYFEVNRDYLFPKDDVELLLTSKNIKINKQRKFNLICVVSLLVVIFVLSFLVVYSNINHNDNTILDDVSVSIDLNGINDYVVLFKYKGGYVYQKIEIKDIPFTKYTNLYLLRVSNTYVNGYISYMNNEKEFDKHEYTEKVFMGIDFLVNDDVRPIMSWHQLHSTYTYFTSQFVSSDEIVFDGKLDLFDGASIERKDEKVLFTYNYQIADLLFDYEYDNILRKCKINNGYYSSSWEYSMIDDVSRKNTFSIVSSYLFESKPNRVVCFDVNSKMINTNRSIEQKRKFELTI